MYQYLSRFTGWQPYQHRVLASVDGQLLPIPINLDTVNGIPRYRFHLVSIGGVLPIRRGAGRTGANVRRCDRQQSGRELYEKFFRNYTRKQWGLDSSELDASVTSRVPVPTNRDDRYFTDIYQVMPLGGYTRMFERMLAHPNIKVLLNADYREIQNVIPHAEVIYTGPIDE